MKNIVKITALAIAFTACAGHGSENTQEQKNTDMETVLVNENVDTTNEIKSLTETLFNETDARNWSGVIATMADSVYTDYTALGGEAGFKSPQNIVDEWQQLLPGFDRTVHQVHNFAIWIAGNRATATFDGIASHYLSGDQWTVFAGYDTEYIKENGKWKLARIDLSLYDMNGNNDLPKKAMALVQLNNNQVFATTSDAEETVEDFFKALENNDLNALLATMDDEVTQEMPLAPDNFPKVLKNKEELERQYTGVMEYTQRYERTYYPTQDPNTVIAKYRGIITTQEGKDYNNYYVGIFTVNEKGKLIRFVEQFNPNILLNGWPGLQPETYSVHSAGARTDSGVELQNISFNSNGVNLQGHLFLPPSFDTDKKYPASIVTGSWTSIKEQMPDEYASLLAQQGFIAMTFDFTGFGESEGQPRQVEDYHLKIADIKAAVDYLSQHNSVDIKNLSGLGVCASSGYMAHATAQDSRIKKLVLVAPWLHNPEIAKSIYDMRPGGTEGLLVSARAAKAHYAETGKMEYVLAASELDPLSAMYVPENAFDYYLNPAKAAGKKYDNRFAVTSWEPWLTFDGIAAAKDITQPVYIIHSESGAVPQGAKSFYELLDGDKKITWLNEFNQQQLYFEKEAVNTAIANVVDYLESN